MLFLNRSRIYIRCNVQALLHSYDKSLYTSDYWFNILTVIKNLMKKYIDKPKKISPIIIEPIIVVINNLS